MSDDSAAGTDGDSTVGADESADTGRDGQRRAMEMVDEPVTTESMTAALRDLGVERGDCLLVHSSLSSLGWVSGGAPAVVDALLAAVGDTGTLAMPTHSTQCSDPSVWENPPLPDGWLDTVKETMSPYRPDITPTYGMGAIPECFRDYPETVRSRHPAFSFAAQGPEASAVVDGHPLEGGLGGDSPLGRLYDREATVLMLGTDHATNTSLHLAEYRADFEKEHRTKGAPMLVDGERQWAEWEDLRIDADDFSDIGAVFEEEVGMTEGEVGAATAKLVDQRALVDFAVGWMAENR